MRTLIQSLSLFRMNASSALSHPGAPLVTIMCVACVVGVLVTTLSVGSGIRQSNTKNARQDRVVVRSTGSSGVADSSIARDIARAIEDAPGIKRDANSNALASPVVSTLVEGQRKKDGVRTNFPLWGVNDRYALVFPEIRIVDGRLFQPGMRELLVGVRRAGEMYDLNVGDQIRLQGSNWTIVGHFEAGGGSIEGVALTDVDTLMSSFERLNYNTLSVMLEGADRFEVMQRYVTENPRLGVKIIRETQDARDQGRSFSRFLDAISYLLSGVMAAGATLGVVSAMYAIVDARRRSIATLRAIGFTSAPIVYAVVLESLALSLVGAIVGATIATVWFNGQDVQTVGLGITLAVTPTLIAIGAGWGAAMGLAGGVAASMRAIKCSVVSGLRAD